MSEIEILKPQDFIQGYGCVLCSVKLIKSYKTHLDSVLHYKNYEKYLASKNVVKRP